MGLFDFIGNALSHQNSFNAAETQLPGYNDQQAKFAAAIKAAQDNKAPEIGQTQVNTAPQDQFRNGQMSFVQALQNQAAGNGPSVAGAQLKQATDANTANQMAMASSSRGGNPALAARIAAQNSAQVAQGNAAAAATGRMQEQLSAQGQLGNALSQGRTQDIGLASDQANIDQQRNLAQAQAALTTNAQNNQAALGYSGLSLNAAQSQMQGSEDAQHINAGIAQKNSDLVNSTTMGVLGGLSGNIISSASSGGGGAGGAGGGMSSMLAGGQGEAAGAGAGGGAGAAAMLAAHGGVIPGKANVSGDSGANDTVPTMLSPGEAVIPRSKMGDPKKAKAFIDHLMKTKSSPQDEAMSYGKVLAAHRKLKASMGEMEQALSAKGKR